MYLGLKRDVGPHFRSYENAAHFLCTLVKVLKVEVSVLYLGEHHGKGDCDQLFGWSRTWINRFIQRQPIYRMNDLVQCYQDGSAAMQREDPESPLFVIHQFDPSTNRANPRYYLAVPTLKITRTYSLFASLDPYSACGVKVINHVFTDNSQGERVLPLHV